MLTRNPVSIKQMVVTAPDFDRLKGLADSPKYRFTHSVLLAALERQLDRSTVVGAADVPRRVVTMRSQVRFRDLDSGDCETYTLVYPQEADLDEGKLSVLAPLGTALLGKHVGRVVEFGVPAGTRRLKIEKILYQPEACGDYHL